MSKLLSLILLQPELNIETGDQIEHYSVFDIDTNLSEHEEKLMKIGTLVNEKIQLRDPNYGIFEAERDRYGNPFFYTSPHQIAFTLSELPKLSNWDYSVMKFLSSLDPKIKVIPWWH